MQKPIQVTEEAYERLQSNKKENESFTDVILRLIPSHSKKISER